MSKHETHDICIYIYIYVYSEREIYVYVCIYIYTYAHINELLNYKDDTNDITL